MSEPKPFIQPPEAAPEAPPVVPVPPASVPTVPTTPVWKRWKTLGFVLLAIVMIPYYTFQAMNERTAAEAIVIDSQVAVKLHVGSGLSAEVIYLDGTRVVCGGHGLAALTWDDFQSQKDRFGKAIADLPKEDFPVVVFFNSSGFDSTGDPVAVRRAKDGSLLYSDAVRLTGIVRHCIPQRDGSFLAVWQDGTTGTVSEQDWYTKYMGGTLQPAEPAKTDTALTGLKGQAIKPTLQGVEPLAGATIVVFQGAIKPADSVTTKPLVNMIVAKDGQYSITLAPGTYTVAVVVDGKIYGNAQDQTTWPTVEVKDSVVSYDIRFTQGLSVPY